MVHFLGSEIDIDMIGIDMIGKDRIIEFQFFSQGELCQEESLKKVFLPDEARPEQNVQVQYSCLYPSCLYRIIETDD